MAKKTGIPDSPYSLALKRIRWPVLLTQAGMIAERVTTAFWPLWSLGFVVWAAISFGFVEALEIEVFYFTALAVVAAFLWFGITGFRKFSWPRKSDALALVDDGLSGHPIAALRDTQAIGREDAASIHVWNAHIDRMADTAASAHAVAPDLRQSKRDPFALRLVAVTAFVVALIFGSAQKLDQLVEAGTLTEANLVGPTYEGWIQPPSYTGLPTIYLDQSIENGTTLAVPQGSSVTLRLYDPDQSLQVVESVSGATDALPSSEFTVTSSGQLGVATDGEPLVEWAIEMIPDAPPTIAMSGELGRTPDGEMKLPFEATDDYGVVAGEIRIELDLSSVDRRFGLALEPEPRDAILLDIPLPYTGQTEAFEDVVVEDLARHPWAGLPVQLGLGAEDAIEQLSATNVEIVMLPARRFFDPLAAAIVGQRRDILWSRENARRVAQVLRAVTYLPEDVFDNTKAYLTVRTAIRRLEARGLSGLDADSRDEIAEMLWHAALLIEDGNVSDAAERLKRAQERLSEALENGASDEELAELMEELRRATEDFLEQMAREAEKNPENQQAQNGEMQEITREELQAMMDEIQELAEQGKTAEAQALLDQLNQMMENMQMAQQRPGQGQTPGQQSMEDLQDTLRQQQQLADDAFRQLQEQFNQNPGDRQPGNGETTPGEGSGQGQGNPDGEPKTLEELAQRQEALRELLDQQREQMAQNPSEDGHSSSDSLERAENNMDAARDALEQGNIERALDEQAGAMDALRQSIQELAEGTAQDQNQGQQGEQAGRADPNSRRDPLGRQTGADGQFGTDEQMLPDGELNRRSQELLDEIRRRSGDRERPRIELDYLERLLDRF